MISLRACVQIAEAVATAAVTRGDATHVPTAAFLRPASQADWAGRTPATRATIAAAL